MSKLIPKHQTPANPLVLQNDNTRVTNNQIEHIPVKEIHPELWTEYKNSRSNLTLQQWLELRNRLIENQTNIIDGNPQRYSKKILKHEQDTRKSEYNKKQRKKQREQVENVVMPMVGVPLLATGLAAAPVATLASLGGGFVGDAIGEELEEHHDFPKGTRQITGFVGGLVGGSTPNIINKTKLVGRNITESVQNFVNNTRT